jgi:hypothetical protein
MRCGMNKGGATILVDYPLDHVYLALMDHGHLAHTNPGHLACHRGSIPLGVPPAIVRSADPGQPSWWCSPITVF